MLKRMPLPTGHRFPTREDQCLLMTVVSAYRCGAVPDSNRIPSCPAPNCLGATSNEAQDIGAAANVNREFDERTISPRGRSDSAADFHSGLRSELLRTVSAHILTRSWPSLLRTSFALAAGVPAAGCGRCRSRATRPSGRREPGRPTGRSPRLPTGSRVRDTGRRRS